MLSCVSQPQRGAHEHMTDTVTRAMIAVAGTWSKLFERGTRNNGDAFVTTVSVGGRVVMADDSPLVSAIFDAHGGMMPDDMKFGMCQSSVDAIFDASEDADLPDLASEYADQEPSVYHAARYAWLASHIERAGYVDDAVSELGAPEPFNISDVIAWGWAAEAREVFDTMARAIAEEAERAEEAARDAYNAAHADGEDWDALSYAEQDALIAEEARKAHGASLAAPAAEG